MNAEYLPGTSAYGMWDVMSFAKPPTFAMQMNPTEAGMRFHAANPMLPGGQAPVVDRQFALKLLNTPVACYPSVGKICALPDHRGTGSVSHNAGLYK